MLPHIDNNFHVFCATKQYEKLNNLSTVLTDTLSVQVEYALIENRNHSSSSLSFLMPRRMPRIRQVVSQYL